MLRRGDEMYRDVRPQVPEGITQQPAFDGVIVNYQKVKVDRGCTRRRKQWHSSPFIVESKLSTIGPMFTGTNDRPASQRFAAVCWQLPG